MSQQLVLDSSLEEAKQTARILYVVHALTFFFSFGLLSIIPLIVNYVKRPYTEGTMVYSHHTWMIRSFWFYILWMVVGGRAVRDHHRHPAGLAGRDWRVAVEGVSPDQGLH